MEVTADLIAFVEHHHVKAALFERDRSFHARGACADDRHQTAVPVLNDGALGAFAQGKGVHGAVRLLIAERIDIEAIHAGDAVAKLILATFGTLLYPFALSQNAAAHADHVALAVIDDLIHEIRVTDAAGSYYGNGNSILDHGSSRNLPAFGTMHIAGHNIVLMIYCAAGGHCNHIRTGLFQIGSDLGGLFRRDSVVAVGTFTLGVVKALHFHGDDFIRSDDLAGCGSKSPWQNGCDPLPYSSRTHQCGD